MNVSLGSALLLTSLVGCHSFQDLTILPIDAQSPKIDMYRYGLVDMPQPQPACAAAKGMTGTNLFCVDLKNFANVDELRTASWDVSKDKTGNNECWEIISISGSDSKAIQIKDFLLYQGICYFNIPPFINSEFYHYTSFTLSVVQTLAIDRRQQQAIIFLSQPIPEQQIWSNIGTNLRQVSKITTTRRDIIKVSKAYQPFFQLQSSAVNSSLSGWQIESIAINGSND